MAKKVMIVDDEPSELKTIEMTLKVEGFEVRTAYSGPEALGTLKKEKPDLVLVDFYMVEMNGRELCERIRADPDLKDLKLAFLTIAPPESVGGEEVLRKLNVSDYIQKPFDNHDLVRRVRLMIGE